MLNHVIFIRIKLLKYRLVLKHLLTNKDDNTTATATHDQSRNDDPHNGTQTQIQSGLLTLDLVVVEVHSGGTRTFADDAGRVATEPKGLK